VKRRNLRETGVVLEIENPTEKPPKGTLKEGKNEENF
jgi:hypothetical protein